GIGANSVIFSVVNSVLLRSSPYPNADRLVLVYENTIATKSRDAVATSNYLDWRDQNQVFEGLATYREDTFTLTGQDKPERVWGAITTSNLFPVIGVKTVLCRY